MTVADKLVIEQTGVIGEKLEITSFERVEAAYVGAYTHIGKIAALVGLNSNAVDDAAVLVKRCSNASGLNGGYYLVLQRF